MTALTVGVTTARDPECKRGVAANIAASLARNAAASARVCVVDADPLVRDVSTRLAVDGPSLEDFVRPPLPNTGQLGWLHSPPLAVVPCGELGDQPGRLRYAAEQAFPALREAFDVLVCDLPGGPSGPGRTIGQRLDLLDWLVLAVTPSRTAVASAQHFLELFETARRRGEIGDVKLAVVCTGDETSASLTVSEVETQLGVATAARIPQLWGRAQPNWGFGPALAIPELDDAVYDLLLAFREGREHRRDLITL